MGILQSLGWPHFTSTPQSELIEIFPFGHNQSDFVINDIQTIYSRILKDVFERTQGIPNEQIPLIWDNVVGSEFPDGLVTLLAKAMVKKNKLCIVFRKDLNIIRQANPAEEAEILKGYKESGQSELGIFVNFANFKVTDMMKIYSELEYISIASLHKSMNLSKSIQLKFSDLRSSTGLTDSADVILQAQAIATGMNKGLDIAIDAKDVIETARPDLTATQSTMAFISQKQSFYLGVPSSYITGLGTQTMGDSGQGDAKAVERGLKNYYFSIVKPVVEKLFEIKTSFKTEDYNGLSTSLEALKTFAIVGNELISLENQISIINKLFNIDTEI